ncbi:MAG TPA: hypothetical protein VKF40_23910 [Burkholderiales bacterium]|nr:hypothetical protein [Burkholderiales bacterium]
MNDHQLWLKSSLFEIEPREAEQTNRGCYGKQLANWLRTKLIETGYKPEEVIAEDWGWCVMCARDPFMLWVGCGSVLDLEPKPGAPPSLGKDVTWSCFVTAEKPFLRGLLKRIDTTSAVEKLYKDVESIFEAEPSITLTQEP